MSSMLPVHSTFCILTYQGMTACSRQGWKKCCGSAFLPGLTSCVVIASAIVCIADWQWPFQDRKRKVIALHFGWMTINRSIASPYSAICIQETYNHLRELWELSKAVADEDHLSPVSHTCVESNRGDERIKGGVTNEEDKRGPGLEHLMFNFSFYLQQSSMRGCCSSFDFYLFCWLKYFKGLLVYHLSLPLNSEFESYYIGVEARDEEGTCCWRALTTGKVCGAIVTLDGYTHHCSLQPGGVAAIGEVMEESPLFTRIWDLLRFTRVGRSRKPELTAIKKIQGSHCRLPRVKACYCPPWWGQTERARQWRDRSWTPVRWWRGCRNGARCWWGSTVHRNSFEFWVQVLWVRVSQLVEDQAATCLKPGPFFLPLSQQSYQCI